MSMTPEEQKWLAEFERRKKKAAEKSVEDAQAWINQIEVFKPALVFSSKFFKLRKIGQLSGRINDRIKKRKRTRAFMKRIREAEEYAAHENDLKNERDEEKKRKDEALKEKVHHEKIFRELRDDYLRIKGPR